MKQGKRQGTRATMKIRSSEERRKTRQERKGRKTKRKLK